MPLSQDEYQYLRETIEQVQGLAELTGNQVQAEEAEPQRYNALSTLLTALGRACDDAIAVAEGMVEMSDIS